MVSPGKYLAGAEKTLGKWAKECGLERYDIIRTDAYHLETGDCWLLGNVPQAVAVLHDIALRWVSLSLLRLFHPAAFQQIRQSIGPFRQFRMVFKNFKIPSLHVHLCALQGKKRMGGLHRLGIRGSGG